MGKVLEQMMPDFGTFRSGGVSNTVAEGVLGGGGFISGEGWDFSLGVEPPAVTAVDGEGPLAAPMPSEAPNIFMGMGDSRSPFG